MATRLYAVAPGDNSPDAVQEAVGSAATSKAINLIIDIASTVVSDQGTTRTVSKEEVANALIQIAGHIQRTNKWPPA